MNLKYKRINLNSELIIRKYYKLKRKYLNVITNKDEQYVRLLFAIMIMEDYNRPWYFRTVEKIVFLLRKVNNKKVIMSLGIMQVQTDHLIGNVESIQLAEKLIDRILIKNSLDKDDNFVYKVAIEYNPSKLYYEEIYKIYNILR